MQLIASSSTTDLGIAIAAAVVAGWVLFAAVGRRALLTAPIVFMLVGLAIGDDAFDLVDFAASAKVIEILAEATLVIVLFADAAKLGGSGLRRAWHLPVRALAIGLPLTVVLGTLLGLGLFPDTHWTVIALLAAILAPTDAALGQAVVTSRAVPERIRSGLSIESGLNDGLIVPVATVFFALARADREASDAFSWIRFAAEQIGYGVLAGAAIGLAGSMIARFSRRAGWADERLLGIGLLAVAFLAWASASALGGNGFIAAFVAGIAVAAKGSALDEDELGFVEHQGQLLVWLTFLAFGGLLVGPALGSVDVRTVVYVIASLTLVRMVPVAIAMIGTGERALPVGFFGWFGPRGLASIVLALQAILAESSPVGAEFTRVVTLTVFASTILHGLTARPAADRLGPLMD